MAEWSNAPVLKTGVPQGTGGSNPSFSAIQKPRTKYGAFFVYSEQSSALASMEIKKDSSNEVRTGFWFATPPSGISEANPINHLCIVVGLSNLDKTDKVIRSFLGSLNLG